jgi:hypothetical protein
MKMLFLSLAASILVAPSVFAASGDIILVTRDENGEPVYEQKPLSAEEAVVLFGSEHALPKGETPTAIIMEEGKPARLTSAPLADIEKSMGGDGKVEVIAPGTDGGRVITAADFTEKPTIDLSDIPEDVPIELFEAGGAFQLQDGHWTSMMTDRQIVGCPQGLDQMASRFGENPLNKSITFSTPYKPTDFSPEFGNFDWHKVGERGYASVIYQISAAKAESQGMKATVRYAMNAVSETKVNTWAQVKVELPAALAALAGMGTQCTATVRGIFERTGD